jgi:hypothetical protein
VLPLAFIKQEMLTDFVTYSNKKRLVKDNFDLVLRLLFPQCWYLKVFKVGESKIKLAEDNLEIDKNEELQALCK